MLKGEHESAALGAGERWQPYWEQRAFSWFDPATVTVEQIVRNTQSEFVQRLVKGIEPSVGRETAILEAGCGTGMYALGLAALGHRVVAFDYNAEAIRYAAQFRETLWQAYPDAKIELYQDNLLAIGAAAESFDLTFNQAVLEYFTADRERHQALCEMARVTRRGGMVAVIVQHTGHPLRGYWERIGWEGYTRQPPVTRLTPRQLATELQAVGLEAVETDGIYPWKVLFWYPRWFERWRATREGVYLAGRALERVPLPTRLRQSMALQIVARGRKP